MSDDDNDGQMVFGDLKLPDICPTGEEKPWKNLPRGILDTCVPSYSLVVLAIN